MTEIRPLSSKLSPASVGALEKQGTEFLDFASGAIERMMPHVKANWRIDDLAVEEEASEAYWTNMGDGTGVLIVEFPRLGFRAHAQVSRRTTSRSFDNRPSSLTEGEIRVCKIVGDRLAKTLRKPVQKRSESLSLSAIAALLDEQIVSEWISQTYPVSFSVLQTIAQFRKLAEQTYENKSIAFGCVIDTRLEAEVGYEPVFPDFLAEFKRYRALSDGFHTAYVITSDGCIGGFLDLLESGRKVPGADENYPIWAGHLVRQCQNAKMFAIALTRNGDILFLGKQGLVWAYRFGRWQLWAHDHIMHMLHQVCRGQRVSSSVVEQVAKRLYQSAMDVSFRRTGGLFVLMANRRKIDFIVRPRDILRPSLRSQAERQFDLLATDCPIQEMSRAVLADMAGLDGAVVVNRHGSIMAYGAVLKTPENEDEELVQVEGSRTRAARAASTKGIAIKASSDGDISIWSKGEIILEV